jgi:hypothetical protein
MRAWFAWKRDEFWYWRVRLAESFWLWSARHLPRRLRYWAFIVAFGQATSGEYGDMIVTDILAIDVLQRLEK